MLIVLSSHQKTF